MANRQRLKNVVNSRHVMTPSVAKSNRHGAGSDITNVRAETCSSKKKKKSCSGGSAIAEASKLSHCDGGGYPKLFRGRLCKSKRRNLEQIPNAVEEPLSAFDLSKDDDEDLITSEGFHSDISELLFSVPDLPPTSPPPEHLNPSSVSVVDVAKDSIRRGHSDDDHHHYSSSGQNESLFCEKQGELVLRSEWIQHNDTDDGLLQGGFLDLPAWPLFNQPAGISNYGYLNSFSDQVKIPSVSSPPHLVPEYQNGLLEAVIQEQQSTALSEKSCRAKLSSQVFLKPTDSSPYESAKTTTVEQKQELQKLKLAMGSVRESSPKDSRTSINTGQTSESVKEKADSACYSHQEEEDIDALFDHMFSAAPLLSEEDASVYLQQQCTHLSHIAVENKADYVDDASFPYGNFLQQIFASSQLSCNNSSDAVVYSWNSLDMATTRDQFALLGSERKGITRNKKSSSDNTLPQKSRREAGFCSQQLSMVSSSDRRKNRMEDASIYLQHYWTRLSHISVEIKSDHINASSSSSVNFLPQISASLQLSCNNSSNSVVHCRNSVEMATMREDQFTVLGLERNSITRIKKLSSDNPLLQKNRREAESCSLQLTTVSSLDRRKNRTEDTSVYLQQYCTDLSHIAVETESDHVDASSSPVNFLPQIFVSLLFSSNNPSDAAVYILNSLDMATVRGDQFALLGSERNSITRNKKLSFDNTLRQNSIREAESCSLQLSMVSSSDRRKNGMGSDELSMVARNQLTGQSQINKLGISFASVMKLCKSPLWMDDAFTLKLNRICISSCGFDEISEGGVTGLKDSGAVAKKDILSLALISNERKKRAWNLK